MLSVFVQFALAVWTDRSNIGQVTQRRIQILDAAAELIAEKGFVQTSVDDVIARAGLSGKSHFYHYFKSKDALGHEVLARQFDLLGERGLAILREGSLDPIERLLVFIDSVVAMQVERGMKGGSPFGARREPTPSGWRGSSSRRSKGQRRWRG